MPKFEHNDLINVIAQGCLHILCAFGLYSAYQVKIAPELYPVYLYGVHTVLFVFQIFKKLHITPIYLVILFWTLICIVNWPTARILQSGFQDYMLSLSAVGLALSAWLMFVFNKRRW